MHPLLNIAIKAARRAGSVINRAALEGGTLEVRAKQANDFVTQVDRAAENAAIDIIRRAYPEHAILAEESGETSPGAEYLWIIDPLDGTTNFIHGFPQYAVSIAVQHRGTLARLERVALLHRLHHLLGDLAHHFVGRRLGGDGRQGDQQEERTQYFRHWERNRWW